MIGGSAMDREEYNFIPGGLVSCFLNEMEVTILKIAKDKITVRVSEKLENDAVFSIKTAFYIFKKKRYEEVSIIDYEIIEKEKKDFYTAYTFAINDDRYSSMVKYIFKDYSRYINLKTYGMENEFSKEMVGYPSELDYDFYAYFSETKRQWMKENDFLKFDQNKSIKQLMDKFKAAVSLHDDVLYKMFLENDIDSFKDEYLYQNYAYGYKIFSKDISRIYIGSEFCHNLFPETEQLIKMIDKAKKEELDITLCFTYMRDCFIEKAEKCIDRVYQWCIENNINIEIVINDWGMLKILKDKTDYFTLCLGTLLNKRKKDPRYMYKNGYEENNELLAENSLNSSLFEKFLKENNIERYEYESCGYKMHIAEGSHSLHMPFYVTNVSQYCPLYAMCKNMDRGKQILVKNCPKYCRDYVFSYPKHLKMTGRYNSLFAFDDVILKDYTILEYYLNNGIDRLVFNFM